MITIHIEPRLEKRTFLPGREIFAQGEVGDCAYLVETGAVTIYQHLNGQRVELGTISQGEIFGEMAAIDGGLRMATAVAEVRTVVTRIPKEMFDRKLGEADKFVRGILNFFIRTVRNGHRTFVRRPRSVGDHLRLIVALTNDLHAFAGRVRDTEGGEPLRNALAELDLALMAVQRAANRCPDNRHDLILDEDEALAKR
jgi:CRP/FNR family transcriptional regulator, cyclic AMP receptor protein